MTAAASDLLVDRLAFTPYALAFRSPVVAGARRLTERRGFLVEVRAGGRRGYGEAAPLPGWSTESLDEAEAALRMAQRRLASVGPFPREDLHAILDANLDHAPASVSWAVATAVLDASADGGLVAALGGPRGQAVRTAALLSTLSDDLVEQARAMEAEGAAALKVKVGLRPLPEEVTQVAALHEALPSLPLRLDGNRRLPRSALGPLAEAAGAALEFFEEPTMVADLGFALPRWPTALDETLTSGRAPPGAAAWVVKPGLLGWARTRHLVEEARRDRVPLVLSSAWETAVGRRVLVHAAAAWAPLGVHGLGTAGALAEDVFDDDEASPYRLTPRPVPAAWSGVPPGGRP